MISSRLAPLALAALLAACASPPPAETAGRGGAPALVPVEGILAEADALVARGDTAASLPSRAAALRSRAARLRAL